MSESESRTISKYGSIYLLANLINRSAGIVLIPVYTRVLSLQEFGLYSIIMAVSDLLAILFGMGFSSAMIRFYFDFDEESAERNQVVSTTFIGFLLLAGLIVVATYPVATLAVSVLLNSTEHLTLFMVAIAGLVFTLLLEIVIAYTIIHKQVWQYLVIATAKAVLFIGFNLLFVIHYRLGVAGIIYATVASLGVLSVLLAANILRKVGYSFSGPLLKEMAIYGLPLIPASFANAALPVVERHFINLLIGPSAVGIYSLGHRLASMLQMFLAKPFSEIFFVRRFETLAKGEDQSEFNRILLVFVALMMTCVLLMSVFGTEIITLISPAGYLEVVSALPILGLCFLLSSLNLNIELGIIYQKKTWTIPLIGLVALVSSIPANYLLIGKYGIMGAALALLLVNILRIATTLLINHWVGTRVISIDWLRVIGILLVGTAMGVFVATYNPPQFDLQWIGLKLLMIVVFLLLLLKSPLLDRESRTQLASLHP